MVPLDLIKEIDYLRKELQTKDKKIWRLNNEVASLRKDNHSLQMKL